MKNNGYALSSSGNQNYCKVSVFILRQMQGVSLGISGFFTIMLKQATKEMSYDGNSLNFIHPGSKRFDLKRAPNQKEY